MAVVKTLLWRETAAPGGDEFILLELMRLQHVRI